MPFVPKKGTVVQIGHTNYVVTGSLCWNKSGKQCAVALTLRNQPESTRAKLSEWATGGAL